MSLESSDQQAAGGIAPPSAKPISESSLCSGAWACMVAGGVALALCTLGWVRMFSIAFAPSYPDSYLLASASLVPIALGLVAGWRLSRNVRVSIGIYGICQLGVGLTGAAVTAVIPVIASAVGGRAWLGNSGASQVWEWVLALLLFFAPAVLEGMALGSFRRFASAGCRASGEWLEGLVLGASLMAAGAGAGLAGFLFLSGVGLPGVAYAGSVLAALSGISALVLVSQSSVPAQAGSGSLPAWATARSPRAALLTVALLTVMFFLTGGILVAWRRLASLVLGPLDYSTVVFLSLFLLALGAGASLGRFLLRSKSSPPVVAGFAFLGLGAATYVSLLLWPELFWLSYKWRLGPSSSVIADAAADGLTIGLAICLPSLVLGALLSIGMAALRAGGVSEDASFRLFPAAVVLALAGGLVSGGWPLFSVWRTPGAVAAAGVLACVLGAVAIGAGRLGSNAKLASISGAVVLAFLTALGRPSVRPVLLTSGPYLKAVGSPMLSRAQFFGAYGSEGVLRVVARGESLGRFASARIDGPGTISLMADGFVLRRLPADRQGEDFAAWVAVALAPAPARILLIGQGSGAGARMVASLTGADATVVEPEPSLVRTSEALAGEELGPGKQPTVANPRSFLRGAPATYDVVISTFDVPWVSGWQQFFTRQFYSLASARLAPGGVFCQSLRNTFIPHQQFLAVVRTFHSVFPNVRVFAVPRTGGEQILMVGSQSEIRLELEKVHGLLGMEEATANLEAMGVKTAADFLAALQFGEREIEEFFGELDVVGLLEDSSQAGLLATQRISNVDVIKNIPRVQRVSERRTAAPYIAGGDRRDAAWAEIMADLAEAYLRAGSASRAREAAVESVNLLRSPRTLAALARVHAASGEFDNAESTWQEVLSGQPENTEVLLELILVAQEKGDREASMSYARQVLALKPSDGVAHFYLGLDLFRQGKKKEAAEEFERALLDEDAVVKVPAVLYNLGACYADPELREYGKAVSLFARYMEKNPRDPMVRYNLGGSKYLSNDSAAAMRQWEQGYLISTDQSLFLLERARAAMAARDPVAATQWLEASLEAFAYNPDALLEKAGLQYRAGNVLAAIETLQKLLTVFPQDKAAYYQLAMAFEAKGDTDSAILNYKRYVWLEDDLDSVGEVDRKLKALMGPLPVEARERKGLWPETERDIQPELARAEGST